MKSKTLTISIFLLFILLLISGCNEKELNNCRDSKTLCESQLGVEKNSYTTCSNSLNSCQSKLDTLNEENLKLQRSYNSLTQQYNQTNSNLNTCIIEKDELNEHIAQLEKDNENLLKKIQNKNIGNGILIAEVLIGFAWIFFGKAIDAYQINRRTALVLAGVLLTAAILIYLI